MPETGPASCSGSCGGPVFKLDAREVETGAEGEAVEEKRVADGEFGLYVGGNAGGEVGAP